MLVKDNTISFVTSEEARQIAGAIKELRAMKPMYLRGVISAMKYLENEENERIEKAQGGTLYDLSKVYSGVGKLLQAIVD